MYLSIAFIGLLYAGSILLMLKHFGISQAEKTFE